MDLCEEALLSSAVGAQGQEAPAHADGGVPTEVNPGSGDFCIDIGNIFTQLIENFLNVIFTGNVAQNFKFDVLDIAWFIVFDEELFVFIFKVYISLTKNKQ